MGRDQHSNKGCKTLADLSRLPRLPPLGGKERARNTGSKDLHQPVGPRIVLDDVPSALESMISWANPLPLFTLRAVPSLICLRL